MDNTIVQKEIFEEKNLDGSKIPLKKTWD